jgi:uncharacterized protein YjbI with pentapeptide repeats
MGSTTQKPSPKLPDGLSAKNPPDEPPQKEATKEIEQSKNQAETARLRAETRKIRLESKKAFLESRDLARWWPRFLPFAGPILTAIIAGCALFFSVVQYIQNQKQAQDVHQDELFSKAIEQLQPHDAPPEQRAAAVAALTAYSKDSTRHKNLASTLIAFKLEQETDPAVFQLSIQALSTLATPESLDFLVARNRQLYKRMARAIGRYAAIDLAVNPHGLSIKTIGPDVGNPIPSTYLSQKSDHLRGLLLETSFSAAQGTFMDDARFFLIPDELAIDASLNEAFEHTKAHKIMPQDEANAELEFQTSVRDLWTNTQAVDHTLKALSGKLAGVNLRRTLLIRPRLEGLDLRGIDARYAMWMAPRLISSDLSFANLYGAEMKYAALAHANLTGGDIELTNFGSLDSNLEARTLTMLRLVQKDVTLDGSNLWAMADCYLRNVSATPANEKELQDRRKEIIKTPEARKYLDKIPATFVDD